MSPPSPTCRTFPSQVWSAKTPWPSDLVGRLLKPALPPLLIMSLPHSGFGCAPQALFMREFVNQGHLACGGATTVFDIDPANPPSRYAQLATRTFASILAFPAGVVCDARQWKLARRTHGQVVIKEVNPFALAMSHQAPIHTQEPCGR